MKISASIYSDKTNSLKDIISDLDKHDIDMFHIDCNDNPKVFEDISLIRKISKTPIDLHLITPKPNKYFELLKHNPVEYLTFQHEDLKEPICIPNEIALHTKLGIAFTSNTNIDAFEEYKNEFDFVLFMATIPGKSGGDFDKTNFQKIQKFSKKYPNKKIHVDGGVNEEVSFILRNMGVYSSVSGSYLFNSETIGSALLNLKTKETESHFLVKDFMLSTNDLNFPNQINRNLPDILKSIDKIGLGFTLLLKQSGEMEGLISNADIRKGLLKNISDFNKVSIEDILNPSPISVNENSTVVELLKLVKKHSFPISYLPVLDNNNKVAGVVTFVNLIKGEL